MPKQTYIVTSATIICTKDFSSNLGQLNSNAKFEWETNTHTFPFIEQYLSVSNVFLPDSIVHVLQVIEFVLFIQLSDSEFKFYVLRNFFHIFGRKFHPPINQRLNPRQHKNKNHYLQPHVICVQKNNTDMTRLIPVDQQTWMKNAAEYFLVFFCFVLQSRAKK